VAAALFRQYRQIPMPDHPDLSDAEIGALLDYLAANGPETERQSHIRPADAASPEEVKLGEKLFYGQAALASGDLACAACHALSTERLLGGTFAPDLTDVFHRYRDRALDQRLRRACLTPGSTAKARVGEQESLALRAFLRSIGDSASLQSAARDRQ